MSWIAFLIWEVVGLAFVGLGIRCWTSKKPEPFGFWSNVKQFEVTNVEKYNKALGKLWISAGIVFALLGIPLLDGQNQAAVIIPILGAMFWAITVMMIYVLGIDGKYRKDKIG